MRIFDEITGEELDGFDPEVGTVNRSERPITHRWIIDSPEEGHWVTVAEYDSGGKDVEWAVDSPEEGHWVHLDADGKDVGWEEEMPEDMPKSMDHHDVEQIQLYHAYTEEELEEIAEERRRDAEMRERAEARENMLEALPEQLSDSDTALCTLYEELLEAQDTIAEQDEAICALYEMIDQEA